MCRCAIAAKGCPGVANPCTKTVDCQLLQMPKLRVPGGVRLGSIKEGDVAAAAAAAAVDRMAADKLALRRLIRPGAPDSAADDPVGSRTDAATVVPQSKLMLPEVSLR